MRPLYINYECIVDRTKQRSYMSCSVVDACCVYLQECIGGRRPIPIHADALDDMQILSDPVRAMEFDFTEDSTLLLKHNTLDTASSTDSSSTKQQQQQKFDTWACRSKHVTVDITANGALDALLVWWHLLDSNGNIMYSTQPKVQNWQDHWVQASVYISITI
jgi:hypothetical protein